MPSLRGKHRPHSLAGQRSAVIGAFRLSEGVDCAQVNRAANSVVPRSSREAAWARVLWRVPMQSPKALLLTSCFRSVSGISQGCSPDGAAGLQASLLCLPEAGGCRVTND